MHLIHLRSLLTHSRGAGFIIDYYVHSDLLDVVRRAPGQRRLGLPVVGATGESWSKMRPPVLGTLHEWCPHCANDLIYMCELYNTMRKRIK